MACRASEVTTEQRERAKAVSYGLVYGMEAFGLSRRLGIPVAPAPSEIMNRYFEGFPSLRAYLDNVVKEIRAQGYSRTEFGRIRPFPDLATRHRAPARGRRAPGDERGHPGTGRRHLQVRPRAPRPRAERPEELAARLILQVHDEVVVEAPPRRRSESARSCSTP